MANAPRPDEAADALRAAETARSRLATAVVVPSYFWSSIAAAVTVQVVTAAIGIAAQDTKGLLVILAGLVLFGLVVGVQTTRFRRRNGVRVDGLVHEVVFGTAASSSTVYVLALGAAVWAAFEGAWALVVLAAVVGGGGYAEGGRRWLRRYRADPATHGRPVSTRWLVVMGGVAIAALAVLVVGR